MFQLGDKIFYPMHGAGFIEAIETKEILGESQLYYIVQLPHRNMQVMLPTDKSEALGLRPVVTADVLEKVLERFHEGESEAIANEHQRHRHNMSKMKGGDIYEGAQVIRDLVRMNKTKKLGAADKTLLDNACQIFASEMVVVRGIEPDQAMQQLNQIIEL